MKNIDEIYKLSRRNDTIIYNAEQSISIIKLRKAIVELDITKLLTRAKPIEYIFVFNIGDLVKTMLVNPIISRNIYRGIAVYTEIEL